jgi:hypothetical protein
MCGGDGPGVRSRTSSIQSAPETCQVQNTEHNIGISMTVPALSTESSGGQQHVLSSAAEQFSLRSRHVTVNHTPPAPHELASSSLPFPGKSKLTAASENSVASGINKSLSPALLLLLCHYIC